MRHSVALMALVCLLATLVACSHQPPRVDCDGHLVPINPPNPKTKSSNVKHDDATHLDGREP